jgi:hypothetical protein
VGVQITDQFVQNGLTRFSPATFKAARFTYVNPPFWPYYPVTRRPNLENCDGIVSEDLAIDVPDFVARS